MSQRKIPEHLYKAIAELVMKHSLKALNFEEMLQNSFVFAFFLSSFFFPSNFCYLQFPRVKKVFCSIAGKTKALNSLIIQSISVGRLKFLPWK